MQLPIRKLLLVLLLAFVATPVLAQSKPAGPLGTQPSAALDLTLHPAMVPAATTPTIPAATLPIGPAPSQPAIPGSSALAPAAAAPPVPPDPMQAASEEVKLVSRWILDTGDNAGLPFVLIDKANAQVFVFSRSGRLQGTAPALLGMARGDRMLVSNETMMAQMPPQVRITPAGRFLSRLGKDSQGKELLILDYDASLSLHPVVPGKPAERRAERLSSATAQDNRISYGCINVPVPFYASIVSPTFTGTKGVVYVLPETSTASAFFGMQPAGTVVSGTQQGAPALNARAGEVVPAANAR